MKSKPIGTLAMNTETLRIIYERRAVRKYKDKPVESELIERVLDAGRMAPSAINKQPWKFYILTNTERIKSFSKQIRKAAAKHFIKAGLMPTINTVRSLFHFSHKLDFLTEPDPIFHGAPVVVFIAAPRDNEWAALDIGMCAQNMMLAAKSLGLDSCPVGLGKYVEQTTLFSGLKISSTDQVHLALIFGYGDESPAVHQRIRDNAFYMDSEKPGHD